MRIVFLLDAENLELSEVESLARLRPRSFYREQKLLSVESTLSLKKLPSIISELALIKFAFQEIFTVGIGKLHGEIKKTDWKKSIKTSFLTRKLALDCAKNNFSEPLLGHLVKESSGKKVSMKNPDSEIYFIFFGGKVICGKLIYTQNNRFEERLPGMRPGFFPSAMHPKMARVFVNLLGAPKNETLYDLMCGTGGFLIEASLMGYKAVGQDISQEMINKARKNLMYYKLTGWDLRCADSLEFDKKVNYVVCDLPFGKNTKGTDLAAFYLSFLVNLRRIVRRRTILGFPSNADSQKMIKKSGFTIKGKFFHFLNKNISRVIYILE